MAPRKRAKATDKLQLPENVPLSPVSASALSSFSRVAGRATQCYELVADRLLAPNLTHFLLTAEGDITLFKLPGSTHR